MGRQLAGWAAAEFNEAIDSALAVVGFHFGSQSFAIIGLRMLRAELLNMALPVSTFLSRMA